MVADSLARTVTRLVADGPTDANLLRRFVATRDEAAFALIVRRHGPMVFGVCRRTLGHQQDAEDAFQAVFLVLARKAHGVRPTGLSRWLYGVAVRVANKARVRRARRATAELSEIAAPPAPPADWLPLLDAALARLPDRDRGPILLCDLLGRSRAEAAVELGIAEGTLSSRLARARDKLRARLARLGASLSLTTLAAGLSDQAAGTVPNSLIESAVAAGTSAAAARELADGVLRTMFLTKIFKLSALGVCAIGLTAAAVVWLPGGGADSKAGGQEVQRSSSPAKDTATGDSDLERIQGTWILESVKGAIDPALYRGFGPPQNPWQGQPLTFVGRRVDFNPFPGIDQSFSLDPSANPKRIDFVFRNVEQRLRGFTKHIDLVRPGIYELAGGKLRLALGDDELRERPSSFDEPAKGSPFTLLVLRRPTIEERDRLVRNEQAMLQGTWLAVTEITGGGSRSAPAGVKLVVKGDRLRFDAPTGPLHATYSLDLTTHPWRIDLTTTSNWGSIKKESTVRGLVARVGYELTLALGTTGRPASFAAASKNGTVYTLMREDHLPRDTPAPHSETKGPETPGKPINARLRQLQEERVKVLEDLLQGEFERVKIGKDPLSALLDPIREWAELKVELAENTEAKVAAQEKALRQLAIIEQQLTELERAGIQTQAGVLQAKAARLKAEIELEKLKAGK